jgi:hypothetical protein
MSPEQAHFAPVFFCCDLSLCCVQVFQMPMGISVSPIQEEKLVAVNNAAVAKSERERKLQTKPNSQAQQSRTIK